MKGKRVTFLALLLSVVPVVFLNSQTVRAELSTGGWNKTYGGTKNDLAYALVQTVDRGYSLAGWKVFFHFRFSPFPLSSHFWLIKTDGNGVVPESPSPIIPAALLVVTSSAVILAKRKFRGSPKKPY